MRGPPVDGQRDIYSAQGRDFRLPVRATNGWFDDHDASCTPIALEFEAADSLIAHLLNEMPRQARQLAVLFDRGNAKCGNPGAVLARRRRCTAHACRRCKALAEPLAHGAVRLELWPAPRQLPQESACPFVGPLC